VTCQISFDKITGAINLVKVEGMKILYAAFVAWGVAIFWLAPHPPMVDLPQHAAQIALLKGLVSQNSPWTNLFTVNCATPYLLGYGLALPLSFVMPVAAAMKTLLSLAYIAFVVVSVRVQQHFKSDSRLIWLFVPSFFGFCYSWGFFTFLLAAPLCLYFVLVADRYSETATVRKAFAILVVGLGLLLSHGLAFVLGWGTGMALLLLRAKKRVASLPLALPYAVLVLVSLIFYFYGKSVDAALILPSLPTNFGASPIQRFVNALSFPLSSPHDIVSRFFLLFVIACLYLAPLFLRSHINWKNRASLVPFFCVCILFFGLPSFTDNTAFLYERFSLFLLPTFAWMLSSHPALSNTNSRVHSLASNIGMTLLIVGSALMLSMVSMRAWKFGQETEQFDALVRALEPKSRALGLIYSPKSLAAGNEIVYLHYASWYQAEKSGLTDFNFAWFTPQIVRFRPTQRPAVNVGFEWNPQLFNWNLHNGKDYRYFFVRGKGYDPNTIFQGAECIPKPAIRNDMWTVFENCTAAGSSQLESVQPSKRAGWHDDK
jgi:hypothetical protein